jgi:hypothetical protein
MPMKSAYRLTCLALGVGLFFIVICAVAASSQRRAVRQESLRVDYPQAGQAISSPLRITGTASRVWFLDSEFSVELETSKTILPVASDEAHVTEAFQGD